MVLAALAAAGIPSAHAATEIGRLALVNGDVRIAKGNPDDAGKPAKPNDGIFNTDVIKTGSGGAAKVLFTDQTLMDIGPNSALKVSDYALNNVEDRQGTFSILYGKLRALVTKKVGPNGKFEVKSGDAVMGVRGTEFLVDAPRMPPGLPSPGTAIVVVAGLVQVRPPNGGPPVPVGAGQMFVASAKSFAAAMAGGGGGSAGSKGEKGEKGDSKSESKGDSKSEAKSESKGDSKSASGGGESKGGGDSKGGGSNPIQQASAAGGGGGGSGPMSDAGPGGGSAGGGVMKVSADQMSSMTSSFKASDNTFMGSVTIAPAAGGGGGSSTAMAAVANLVATAVALPPPPPPAAILAPPPPPPPTLPPVSIVPGNQVHLSVSVQ